MLPTQLSNSCILLGDAKTFQVMLEALTEAASLSPGFLPPKQQLEITTFLLFYGVQISASIQRVNGICTFALTSFFILSRIYNTLFLIGWIAKSSKLYFVFLVSEYF